MKSWNIWWPWNSRKFNLSYLGEIAISRSPTPVVLKWQRTALYTPELRAPVYKLRRLAWQEILLTLLSVLVIDSSVLVTIWVSTPKRWDSTRELSSTILLDSTAGAKSAIKPHEGLPKQNPHNTVACVDLPSDQNCCRHHQSESAAGLQSP